MPHPLIDLARRFTIDWLDRADADVPPTIMTPDYRVHIGGVELAGLPAYADGTIGQLRQFPGLMLTVHRVVSDGERLALVFTEHGASAKHDLRAAAWTGVALFRWDGERLTENWTQEDYYARRRQLADGVPDMIGAPAVAPWTTPVEPGRTDAVEAVRAWLAAPDLAGVTVDDGRDDTLCLEVTGVTVDEVFAAGGEVAFAATWTGTYAGTLDSLPEAGADATLGTAGVMDVDADGRVTGGHVVTDRLGLRRSLLPARPQAVVIPAARAIR